MLAEVQAGAVKSYCNLIALEKGLDPAGSAGDFEDAIIIETPLPWKRDLYQQAGVLPQQIIDLMALWMERYQAGQGYPHRPLLAAPDSAYSRNGFRRVMLFTRQSVPFACYDKTEYLVPDDELGALAWALYENRDDLSRFEQFRLPEADSIRDVLVCTHGTIDAACAKFGFPLYNDLRKNHASDRLRAWRVSHFGGHVFAPTLMDMPGGHYWAYVEENQAAQIVRQTGDVTALRGHYRGWAGIGESFLQVAERELWQRYGWEWFSYRKSGLILAQEADTDNPAWAEVRIDYSTPDGRESGAYTARVELQRYIETIHTTGIEAAYPYPQYSVTRLEKAE